MTGNRLSAVDGFIRETANLGGRGADDLRWHRPLRPGTTVSGRVEVLSKTAELLVGRRPDEK